MKPAWRELIYAINGAFLFLLIILATEIALGQSTEVPESARVLKVQTVGAGCEATQSVVSLAPDLQAISILFSNFNLELGPGSPQPHERVQNKNCQIRIEIETPQGWSLAIKSVDYRGFAHLPTGASAKHRFSYQTDGGPPTMLREAPLHGPIDQDYFFRLEQPPSERRHSACGPPNIRLRLNTHMTLKSAGGDTGETALLSLDSADMSLHQDFRLEWKRCGGRKKTMR